MDLQHRVQERMRSEISPRARVLCAISGGPDSVALAHLLKSLPYPVVLGHVDHQLRKNSGRDAQFVQNLAKRWDVPVEVARVRIAARGRGVEDAAREKRYAALTKMAEKIGCSVIVTAH